MNALLFAGLALALEGVVVDSNGAPVVGAHVEVRGPPTTGVRGLLLAEATSGSHGNFSVEPGTSSQEEGTVVVVLYPGLPAGQWTLAELSGDPVELRLEEPRSTYRAAPMSGALARPPTEIELEEWSMPPLAPCGQGCVDLVFDADGERGRPFLVRVTGDVRTRDFTCSVRITTAGGRIRPGRCSRRGEWTSLNEGVVHGFLQRPGELQSAWITLHGTSFYVGLCEEHSCYDIIRQYPEDAQLAHMLAMAYRAARQERAWPYPTPR